MKLFLSALVALSLPLSANAAGSFKRLSANDPVEKITKVIRTKWEDGNISTGTSTLLARKLTGASTLSASLLKKLYTEIFDAARGEEFPSDIRTTTTLPGDFTQADATRAIRRVMDGNDYNPDNSEILESYKRDLFVVLRKLDPSLENLEYARVTAKVPNNGDEEDLRDVTTDVFYNTETKVLVFTFVIEGRM